MVVPCRWLAVIFFLVTIRRPATQHERELRIGLVILDRAHVEEDALVSIRNQDAGVNALVVIVLVIFILKDVGQAIRTKAPANSLCKCVVPRLVSAILVAVGTVQAVKHVGCLGISRRTIGPEVWRDTVLAVVCFQLLALARNLGNLDLYAVLELLTPWPFPHGTGD